MRTNQQGQHWQRSVEGVLLALALRNRAKGREVPGDLPHSNMSHVAPVDGNDSTATGSTTKPFKTLNAALDRMGKPLSQADFEAPWVIQAVQPGHLSDDAPFVKVPTRRLTLRMPGVFLPAAIEFEVRDADKFGSPYPAELALIGGPPGRFGGGHGDVPTDAFRIRNTVGNALLVDAETEGVAIRMEGVALSGHFLHAVAPTSTAGVTLEAVRSVFSGVNTGPGLAAIIGGPAASKCFAWLRECVTGGNYGMELRTLLEASGCYIGGPVTVQDVPSDVVIGVNDTTWLHGSSWTGPAGSLLVDGVSNYWLTKHAIPVSNGAKLVMG